MLPAVARYASYVPMPTLSQAALLATTATSCGLLSLPWSYEKSNLGKVASCILHASIFVSSKTGFVSLCAAAQKKFPLLSRGGIVVLTPFILMDCASLIKRKDPSETLESMVILGVLINLVVTGVFFYQHRSFSKFFHVGVNLANMAFIVKEQLG